MKPSEIVVGETYRGEDGTTRKVMGIKYEIVAFRIGNSRTTCWWGRDTFASWARERVNSEGTR